MNRSNPRVTTVLLARRRQALKRNLKQAVEGDGKGVHQARVASRRLREAVPVLATGLKKSKADKAGRKIRRITKALGSIRELDVTVSLIDELAQRDTVPRLALEHVRARVIHEQESRRVTMLKRLDRVKVAKLDRRLQSLSEALEAADAEQWRETLAARLLKRSKLLRAALENAGQLYEAERLHQVRIAAKKLRYALELAAETGLREAKDPVLTIKRAQDMLGRLHDLQVLQTYVASVLAEPQSATPPDGGLEIIARLLEDECRRLHARYVSTVPALLSVVELTRSSLVPSVAQPGRRGRRHLKMDLGTLRPRAGRSSAAVNEGR
jgi:CHAD domain-containing protein